MHLVGAPRFQQPTPLIDSLSGDSRGHQDSRSGVERFDLLAHEVPAGARPELSGSEQRMLQLVGYERVTADELSQPSALPVARVMAELSSLELLGVVSREGGGYIRN